MIFRFYRSGHTSCPPWNSWGTTWSLRPKGSDKGGGIPRDEVGVGVEVAHEILVEVGVEVEVAILG